MRILKRTNGLLVVLAALCAFRLVVWAASAEKATQRAEYPPELPDGKPVATDTSEDFLRRPQNLREGVEIATTPPTIDFLYYSGQTYRGKPWSAWGDSLAVDGKYYSAIGDHLWNAFLYEYDDETKELRMVVDVSKHLNVPEGHYTPGKVHGRIDVGSDGWVYFATHRGSPDFTTTDKYHFKGAWILRYNPETGKTETVVHAPAGRKTVPASVLDPDRLIFYGGTPDTPDPPVRIFFAYDVKNRKLLYKDDFGPYRYLIFSKSTGRVYYINQGLRRYDPETNSPTVILEDPKGIIGIRAATQETPQGYVYTVSGGRIYRFNVKTEKAEMIGEAPVGRMSKVTSIDADPTGRYLYYSFVCHEPGRARREGVPIVQFDTKTCKRKVIAFLMPFYGKEYGFVPCNTFSSDVSPDGSKVYVTWYGERPGKGWEVCALTVIHIPESERKP